VKEAPDELARNIFETKLEVRVLKDGVMPALKGERADRIALLVGDFFAADDAW